MRPLFDTSDEAIWRAARAVQEARNVYMHVTPEVATAVNRLVNLLNERDREGVSHNGDDEEDGGTEAEPLTDHSGLQSTRSGCPSRPPTTDEIRSLSTIGRRLRSVIRHAPSSSFRASQ